MTWYVLWSLGWPLFVGYWSFLVVFCSEEISARMLKVSKWMIFAGYLGALVTAFFLPYVELPWIVRD